MFALATSPDANNDVTSTPRDASLPSMAIDYGLRAMAVVEEPQRPSSCCACIAREAGPMGLTVDVTAIFVIPYMDCLLERDAMKLSMVRTGASSDASRNERPFR